MFARLWGLFVTHCTNPLIIVIMFRSKIVFLNVIIFKWLTIVTDNSVTTAFRTSLPSNLWPKTLATHGLWRHLASTIKKWLPKLICPWTVTFSAPVTLTLTRWPSYTKFSRIPWRYTRCAKMSFLCQGFPEWRAYIHAYHAASFNK